MKILIERYMDDGYGNTHFVEEGTFDDKRFRLGHNSIQELYEIIQKENEIIREEVMGYLPTTHIEMDDIGNPNGYGNEVDEYRIYVDGEHYKTI